MHASLHCDILDDACIEGQQHLQVCRWGLAFGFFPVLRRTGQAANKSCLDREARELLLHSDSAWTRKLSDNRTGQQRLGEGDEMDRELGPEEFGQETDLALELHSAREAL